MKTILQHTSEGYRVIGLDRYNNPAIIIKIDSIEEGVMNYLEAHSKLHKAVSSSEKAVKRIEEVMDYLEALKEELITKHDISLCYNCGMPVATKELSKVIIPFQDGYYRYVCQKCEVLCE